MYQKRFKIDKGRFFSGSFPGSRAQVTLFIILGLVLLLAVGLVIVIKTETFQFKPEELEFTRKGKVEQFITSCIEEVGEDALFRAGQQGGYIEVPAEIANDGSQHLRLSPIQVIPYWAYGENVRIPPLPAVKERIDRHIEENLRDCLFGREAFQETYNLVEKSGLSADTVIAKNKVIFNVNWNVEVRDKAGEVITELVDHTAESSIKLKKVYETAERIVDQEMITLKLEDITQDLIALEHPDLPLAGTALGCSRKVWDADKAKSALQDLLRVNLRQLKISGTEFIEFPENFPYYRNHYVWEMGEDFAQSAVSVVFNYDDNFPFLFQVTPAEGKQMASNMMGGTEPISLFCLQMWKFTYDVMYPVLVRVRDDTTGYTFNIALTVHLVRNRPDRRSGIFAQAPGRLNFAHDERYCANRRVPMLVSTWETVESAEQGVYQKTPLEGVNLSFTCVKYRCELGPSLFNYAVSGYRAGLETNFPYCVGGLLRGVKDGYKEDWQMATTEPGGELELELAPLLAFPASQIKVLKHPVTETGEIGPARALDREDSALIKVIYRKADDRPGQPFHEASLVRSPGTDERMLQQQKLDFLAGADFTYELEINLFDAEQYIGGYKTNWTVPWLRLDSGREIVFHTLSREGAADAEMFELLSTLEEKSRLAPLPEIR